ncbi:MAG: MscL family protein [Nitrososphaeraceae archaeon]
MPEAPVSSPPKEKKRGFTQEFIFFLKTFGIIGLAIAFIIGQAASKLVTAFVNDIIDPIIGIFLPGGNLSGLSVQVPNLYGDATSDFRYGDLIANIIDFMVIALIVFILYKQLSKRGFVEDKTVPEEKK